MAESVASLVERLWQRIKRCHKCGGDGWKEGREAMSPSLACDGCKLDREIHDALEAASRLSSPEGTRGDVTEVAQRFIAYYRSGGGCTNCGGLPHSSSCFVWQFEQALSSPSSAPAATPAKEENWLTRQVARAEEDGAKLPPWQRLNRGMEASPRVSAATPAPEELAQRFHEAYERLAPEFGYSTRESSRKPWADVPEQNKRLMVAVCAELLPCLSAAERPAPTCATCEFWKLSDGEQLSKPHLRIGECRHEDFPRGRIPASYPLTNATFGCTLHEPAPPGPGAKEKE